MGLDANMGQAPVPDEVNEIADTSINRMATGAGISLFGVGLGRGLDFVKQIALARLLGRRPSGYTPLAGIFCASSVSWPLRPS